MGTINNFGCVIGQQIVNTRVMIKWAVYRSGSELVCGGSERTEEGAKRKANELLKAVDAKAKGGMYAAHVYVWPIVSIKSANTGWAWKDKL